MDIAAAVKEKRNKAGMEALAEWVDGDPDRFAETWHVMQHGTTRDSECASWMVDKCLMRWPELLLPFQYDAYTILRGPFHQAVHRCLTKNLLHVAIADDLRLPLFDYCIDAIGNESVSVAVRCHCILLGWKIAEPDDALADELGLMIRANMQTGTAGFRNRGSRVLKWIESSRNSR